MNSEDIRSRFLAFFNKKQHEIVSSAPMVIKNDPTLMFTNAGMNQFKDVFLDNAEAIAPRVANSQKCLRVSGKHNDLEEVGVDTYHHTMFEMLGNWSFGDYFKKEAIAWAWEFLIDDLKINPDIVYVTVFEGDDEDGLEKDQEAYDEWKKVIAEDRILNGNKKDNFWEMGETGPCGPCSEIHVDLRSDEEKQKVDGKSLVNADHPQVVEVWNLVFMQFNRLKDKSLQKLKNTHVDTGMGLERLCMVMQGKKSNYDTDLFQSSIQALEKLCGKTYQASDSKEDVSFRVIADHVRAVAFAIADGQLPSNTGAGYVIRRILRRAVRYGFSFLNFEEPFMYQLVPVLEKKLGGHFEELIKQADLIGKVIQEEEQSFLKTLDKGLNKLGAYQPQNNVIDGAFAFELYDTFGFPIDLTALIASEKGWTIDQKAFDKHLKEQKDRSRAATAVDTSDWVKVADGNMDFIGYDFQSGKAKIIQYRKAVKKDTTLYQLVFDQTPFYPEGGGQVGDKGLMKADGQEIKIIDTKKENGLILHFTKELPSDIHAEFELTVFSNLRLNTEKNHSATHLLHHVLRSVLGEHVEQKGSLVNDQYLRFDFSHFQKVSEEELAEIEKKVNQWIDKGIALNEYREIDIEEAKSKGAMALFGEKYGDKVRMIEFGDSKELCGGTHVANTSQIGGFKIVSEGSVASGVRRIEAITGDQLKAHFASRANTLQEIENLLGHPKNLVQTIQKLQEEHKELSKEIEALINQKASMLKADLKGKIQLKNGVNFLAEKIEIESADAIKNIAFQLKGEVDNLFMVLGANIKGKPNITVVVSEELGKSKDLNAGQIVRELAKEIKGGGGGQPFYATAGGKDISGLDNVIAKAEGCLG